MTSSSETTSSTTRRFKVLGASILGFVALFTAVWFFAASKVEERIDLTVKDLEAKGQTIQCLARDIRGYPFRMGLFCNETRFTNSQVTVTAGSLRSAAQIYAPRKLFSELDGPLRLSANDGTSLLMTWESLASSFVASQPLPERASLEAKQLKIEGKIPNGTIHMDMANMQAHMRERGQAADVAFSIRDLIAPPVPDMQPASFNFDASIDQKDILIALRRGKVSILRGESGTLHDLTISFKDRGSMSVSGPLAFNRDGFINGTLTIKFTNLSAFTQELTKFTPALAPFLERAKDIILPLLGSDESQPIRIDVENGRVKLGFIPLFELPPI